MAKDGAQSYVVDNSRIKLEVYSVERVYPQQRCFDG